MNTGLDKSPKINAKNTCILPYNRPLRCAFLFLYGLINLFWLPQTLKAQEFRSPLNIPLVLAGTFGELRTNHFHAGLDIKTNGTEGYSIYAIADGYVSRIKVQPGGYGKALYITHPNGYTSVYGHLSSFKDAIGQYVTQKQYEKQSFEIDLYPAPGELNVQKNQIVALSGNSGGSSGPHLHFEIRNTGNEHALNPLQFYNIADSKPPVLTQTGIVAFNDQGLISENTIYYNKAETPSLITVAQPRIGVCLNTYDLLNDAPNKNGVYAIKMFDDGNLVYHYTMDELDFEESRYLNSHIHYQTYCNNKRLEHRCFKEPANKLNNYKNLVNNGIIELFDGKVHTLTFEISDIKNNTTQHKIKVKYDQMAGRVFDFAYPTQYTANWGESYNLVANDFIFETHQEALYNTVYLSYQSDFVAQAGNFSPKHTIEPSCYAFHKACKIRIRPYGYDASISDKMLIVSKNDKGKISGLWSKWESDYLVADTKTPGTFYVTADFDAPNIRPSKPYSKGTFKNGDALSFIISDNLSGIKSYNAYISGSWVLLDYDAKNAKITHKLDQRTAKGLQDMLIVIEDVCGNKTNYQFSFTKSN